MRSILIHEYVSGGGELADEAEMAELLPMGRAMRDALLADLLRVPDLQVTCATSARAGLPFEHPRLRAAGAAPGESAIAFVRREAALHDAAWIVAPESDGVLAEMHAAVGGGVDAGAGTSRWIGCSAAAIRTGSSKQATLAALARCRVQTPLDFVATAEADRLRWIVKPDDGAGAVATQLHLTLAAAQADQRQRAAAGQRAALEPFVPGEALSISLLAGPGFVQPLAFNEQKIEVSAAGRLSFQGVRINAIDRARDPRAVRLHTLALDVKRALPGLRGFVGIDLVWHAERGPVVIEVNPRLTCAYVGLSAALGRNIAEEALLLHTLPEPADAGA